MIRWKKATALLLAFAMTGSMAACGRRDLSSEAVAADTYEAAADYSMDAGWGIPSEEVKEESAASYQENESDPVDASLSEEEQQALGGDEKKTARKLIRTVDLYLETTEFDQLSSMIEEKTEEMGGYIESSTLDGTKKSSSRYCYLTVRIPDDQLNAFETLVGNSATILSRNSNVQDVTLRYSDLAAHISSLRIEQEALMEMLSKAESVDVVITIQNELTNIRYELESYESQLKLLDNQINYSTVCITIREVKVPTAQEKEGFFGRVKHTFMNNISDIGEGIEDFFVFFFGNIVGIILFLAIVAGILLVVRAVFRFLFRKKNTEKKNAGKKRIWRKKKELKSAEPTEAPDTAKTEIDEKETSGKETDEDETCALKELEEKD
ncbi:MAG: DUF4349 domain-containing protein [Lachnospiraceae bacterium]|nr:DUF4349 domain-containing protein [Lachnospiraceae bacterium]